jgi:hypothetical protein
VFCEGSETEPAYLEALRREPVIRETAAVELRIEYQAAGSAPLTLVTLAAEARRRALDAEEEIDEFWCVFDVEWPRNHPNLSAARDLARRNGISLAVSNPCFELWLLLHFTDQRSFLDTPAACRARRTCDGQPGKSVRPELYMPHRSAATQRAEALERWHAANGTTFPHDNPSSGMFRLIRSVTTTSR